MSVTTDDGMMSQNGFCADMDYDCIAQRAYNLSSYWLAAGARHLDTGNHYKAQQAVAKAIKHAGLNRSDVPITSKFPGTIGYDTTMQCQGSGLRRGLGNTGEICRFF